MSTKENRNNINKQKKVTADNLGKSQNQKEAMLGPFIENEHYLILWAAE